MSNDQFFNNLYEGAADAIFEPLFKGLLPAPSSPKTFYAVLGVSESAQPEEIHQAYVRICKEHHPDKHGGVVSDFFQAATDAHTILMDPVKRRIYDETELNPDDEANAEQLEAAQLLRKIASEILADGMPQDLVGNIIRALRADIGKTQAALQQQKYSLRKWVDVLGDVDAHFEGPEFVTGTILGMVNENIDQLEREIAGTESVIREFEIALKLAQRCKCRKLKESPGIEYQSPFSQSLRRGSL